MGQCIGWMSTSQFTHILHFQRFSSFNELSHNRTTHLRFVFTKWSKNGSGHFELKIPLFEEIAVSMIHYATYKCEFSTVVPTWWELESSKWHPGLFICFFIHRHQTKSKKFIGVKIILMVHHNGIHIYTFWLYAFLILCNKYINRWFSNINS